MTHGAKCLECAAAWTLCLWLHERCLWLHGLSRSAVDMINCCSVHVSQLLDGLYVKRSETVVGKCLSIVLCKPFSSPIAFRRQTLQLRQSAQHFMETVREQNVAHHVLSQSMFMELKITKLFGGGCGVISAPASDLTDSTCSESHKHDFAPHPTGTEKKLDQERTDINILFVG